MAYIWNGCIWNGYKWVPDHDDYASKFSHYTWSYETNCWVWKEVTPVDDCDDKELLSEDFDDIHDPDDSRFIVSDGHWDIRNNKLYTDGCNDGSVVFTEVHTDKPVEITLDIKSVNACKFESWQDKLVLEAKIDGHWVLLDEFRVNEHTDTFHGSKTGQTFNDHGGSLTYKGGALDSVDSSVQLRITSDFSWSDEIVLIDNVKITTDGDCVTCEGTKVDFNDLHRGDVVSDQIEGVTISAQRAGDHPGSENDAMIFDSANPTGGDWDLKYSNQGKILIISEDNDSHDPDDNAHGGTFTFDFDVPSDVQSITALDNEEGGKIKLFDADGNLIKTVDLTKTGNNGKAVVDINGEGVSKMVVELHGSGALDDLCFTPSADPEDASISGRYFIDGNGNALDDGEPGVDGVVVELLDADGNVVATDTTDGTGAYSFDGLAAGDYAVRFPADPDGRVFVAQDAGDDTIDSDVNPANGTTATFSVAASETVSDVDAGVADPGTASLAGRVFEDTNGNAFDDNNGDEPGLGEVTVRLLDGNGNFVAETTTADDGSYIFEDLDGGQYIVEFPTNVQGLTLVQKDVGGDQVDSDADQATGRTDVISLAVGQAQTDVDAGLFDDNTPPVAGDDSAAVCANEVVFIDVLDNDTDDDGDLLVVHEINGQAVEFGESVVLDSGAVVTVGIGGTLSYDTTNAVYNGVPAADLLIGQEAMDSFSYTVSDGQGGESVADVDLKICGAKNTLETIADRVVPDQGHIVVTEGETGDFDLTISDTGNDQIDGTYAQAYCIDFDAPLPGLGGSKISVEIDVAGGEPVNYDVINPQVASPDLEEDLDNIGWILNEDFASKGYTESEIQAAIWGLTNETIKDLGDADGIPDKLAEAIAKTTDGSTVEKAMEIFTLARTQGEGYEAQEPGDIVALVLTPDGSDSNVQPFVVGIDFDDLDEECECELMV